MWLHANNIVKYLQMPDLITSSHTFFFVAGVALSVKMLKQSVPFTFDVTYMVVLRDE